MFFKRHVERVRMDVCNLGKTEVILGMPWLVAHNPEIDWEKGEVKMMWCPPICGKRRQEEKEKEVKKAERDECKGIPLFPPLNGMTTLWSYLSLFTSGT